MYFIKGTLKLLILVLFITLLRVKITYAVTFTDEQVAWIEQRMEEKEEKRMVKRVKSPVATVAPIKVWAPVEQQELVNYARSISNNIDFILTVERESGFRWDAIGDWNTSYGLCQRHVPGKKNRRLTSDDVAIKNWYNMLDKCRWSYQIKEKTTGVWSWLHAYSVRHTVVDRFIIN